jgi:hypothetical protein
MAKRKAPQQQPQQTKPALVASIEGMTQELGIQFWDLLIVGDGSGSGWDKGTGWSCVLLDRFSWHAKLFYGGINTGTITIGELFPYLHALIWYFSGDGPGKDRLNAVRATGRAMQVHIVTDNAAVALGGNVPESRHSNLELWCALDHIRSRGVSLVFHHWRRDSVSLNILADEVARQSRVTIEKAYGEALKVLARKYPGIPADASPEDFFLWR